ncbi:Glycosyl transferase family 11 [Pseudobutyrivibrio ruminis]|uniref:Glycosyl transferase family 11 n=1 Tax=Pseudobutyrivibrio ruminis TaxID=46206 RepID=A0A1H7H5T1_9FIRM|nr:alpha-1,2-fucosyltransferase [Pseudobutyrivibrio ruminis]SEK45651.1 Glycosyl transferase family 11 [Pseudobutyrivibrio ruminis]
MTRRYGENRDDMIKIKYAGGLGNQMFQYAFAKMLKQNNKEIIIDSTSYKNDGLRDLELNIFKNIDKELIKDSSLMKKILFKLLYGNNIVQENESQYRIMQSRFFEIDNVSIVGYFQSAQYFENIRDYLLNDFCFEENDLGLLKLINEVEKEESVAIHVRRGDYLKFPEIYGNICTIDYYSKAIEYIRERHNDIKLYIFSDDIEWTKKQKVFEGAVFVESNKYTEPKAWMDMCLMSHCKHNIIANSSYSWWASYLNKNNQKIIVMPKRWDSYGEANGLVYKNCVIL